MCFVVYTAFHILNLATANRSIRSTLQKNRNTFHLHIHNFLIISFLVLRFVFYPVDYGIHWEKKMFVYWRKKTKQPTNGKIVFICAPALNYAIHKDANVLNIKMLVKIAHECFAAENEWMRTDWKLHRISHYGIVSSRLHIHIVEAETLKNAIH